MFIISLSYNFYIAWTHILSHIARCRRIFEISPESCIFCVQFLISETLQNIAEPVGLSKSVTIFYFLFITTIKQIIIIIYLS